MVTTSPSPRNSRVGVRHPKTAVEAVKVATGLWWILTVFALLVGAVSLRYALPHIPHPARLPNITVNHNALILHAISASLALLLGPWQFLSGLRKRQPQIHRLVGWTYTVSLLIAASSAVWIAPHAAGGHVSTAGFLGLALGWLVTTSSGVIAIRRRRIPEHRRWMIRSYALTAAAITLRIYLLFVPLFHLRFGVAYPTVSWLCWVPNLLLAELWIRWTAARTRSSGAGATVSPATYAPV